MVFHRIAVVGVTGSGKTTLAQQLAGRLNLPHVELDALYWQANWTASPTDVFRARVAEALNGERWVVDGNYREARDIVWRRADTLIWLDYPLPLVLWRLLRRTAKRVFRREILWNGNHETLRAHLGRDSLFLWALKSYPKLRRQYPLVLRAPEYAHLQVVHLVSPRQTRLWLSGVAAGQEASSGIPQR